MPQVVAVIVKVAVSVLVKVGFTKATALLIANFALKLAVTVAASAVMRASQPRPRGMQQGVELQTKVDPAFPREVATGLFATGGSLGFEDVSGTKNKYLWRRIDISDAEIEEITQVRGNGEALTFTGDIHTGLRPCTSHFQSAKGADMLYMRIYKGTSSQTADADLLAAFGYLDSNFRCRGVAYALIRMEYDTDAWGGGADFVFVGKGAKCFDPRTDTTVWTDNPALIAGQFLRGFENNGIRVVGLGAGDDDLPDADFEAAADECDDLVSLDAGGTEARYRAGGMISARDNAREIMAELMASMAGAHIDRGGEIAILPGVARTPVLDIAEDDLLADEGIVWVDRNTSDERINCISSTFVSPDEGWQEAPLPPRKDAAAITADGGRFEIHNAYARVYSKTQGQRLDEIALRRGRLEGFWAISAPLWAFELTPGDWVTATNKRWGNVEKTFEVETVGLNIVSGKASGAPQARCALTLREIASTVYDWDESDELTVTAGGITHPAMLTPNIDAFGRLNGAYYSGNPLLAGAQAQRTPTNPLSSSDAGSTATISVAAHVIGTSFGISPLDISFDAGSITGLSFATGYHVFAYDPGTDGGAVTYQAELDLDLLQDIDYIYVGPITTKADGGGSGGDDPPFCVSVDAWLRPDLRAGDAKAGDLIDVLTPDRMGYTQAPIRGVDFATVPGVIVDLTNGKTLTMSAQTDITQPDGSVVKAHASRGALIAVKALGAFSGWHAIAAVRDAGVIDVAQIHIDMMTFAAGDDPDWLLFTHNLKWS